MTQAHNLPSQPTPLIGRDAEISDAIRLLHDPACRLLTVVGPGGVGKTRLAIAAAARVAADFAAGVTFVDLQPVGTADSLATAIADALNFPISGREAPHTQLFNYLSSKEMLLLLDNFEHLLDKASFLSDLLPQAPAVQLFVTSREALNLQEEWLYPLQGLPAPSNAGAERVESYGAVQLFLEHARRLRPNFSLGKEKSSVVRICKLVGGLPLALEMAAAWTKMLSCAAIAAEIERNIAFLSAQRRNVPPKHRSMQVVFDQSWQLLRQEERAVFQRLSVFRGNFGAGAATHVAGATLPLLLGLVDKSLLRAQNGRYHLHELLRQYAQGKLEESPEEKRRCHARHSSFYAGFLHKRLESLMGGRQKEAMAEIEPDLENIRAAWQWAVRQMQMDHLQKSSQALGLFYQIQGRYVEGANAFADAVQALAQAEATAPRDDLLLKILMDQAWFYIRLGWLAKAESALAQCREIYRQRQIPPVPGHGTDPALAQGIIASIRGDYAEAARLGEEAHQVSERHAHLWNRQFACYVLSRAAQAQGQYDAAQEYARQAYSLAQETNDRWFMAYCHNELGNVAQALGEYEEARQHYRASFALRESFDDPEGMALALNHLGETAVLQARHAAARRLYQQSRDLYEEINDKGGLATALKGLGTAACGLEEYDSAQQYLHEALQIATGIQYVPLIFSLFLSIGELWLQTTRPQQGVALLALTRHHAASPQTAREKAKQRLAKYEPDVAPDLFHAAMQKGRDGDLEKVTAELLAKLSLAAETAASPPSGGKEQSPSPSPELAEPLTRREREILRLLAQGLTNREIAEELTIVVGTVKAHNHNIYGKLDVNNRTEAVVRAQEMGLI